MDLLRTAVIVTAMAVTAGNVAHAAVVGGVGVLLTAGDTASESGFTNLPLPFGNVSNPADTVGQNNFNDNELYAFDEVQALTLTADLALDNGVIAAGTTISSHYVFFDPPGGFGAELEGSVQFDGAILGVITSDAGLVATDSDLGAPEVAYVAAEGTRGLESSDFAVVDSQDDRLLNVFFIAGNPGDYLRVITAPPVNEVPLPATLPLALVTCLIAASRIKRRHRATSQAWFVGR